VQDSAIYDEVGRTRRRKTRIWVVFLAGVLSVWCALLCFLSLLVVSERDPSTAIAASLVPVALVPLAITAWWRPTLATWLSAVVLLISDFLCAWPHLHWRVVAGCAVHFTGWGYLGLLVLFVNWLLKQSEFRGGWPGQAL
jgi:hypothetical protein